MTSTEIVTGERADILETLRLHRQFLKFTARGLTEEQAREASTASSLSIGGLIKHVAETEKGWVDFVLNGPAAMSVDENTDYTSWENAFQLTGDETLEGVIALYDKIAAETDELVKTVDLDKTWPLPEAPWFPPNATRSARRVFMHIATETAQHSGHADIIRETIDGQKTMG